MSHQTWHIPANYTDAGKLFGMFAIRYTIEAVLLAGPCIFFTPFSKSRRENSCEENLFV